MNQVTIRINNMEFGVSVDGTVHQPHSVSGVILDEVRLQASERFLGEKGISLEQRKYWRWGEGKRARN